MNAPRAIEEIVAQARVARPDLTIIARARDAHHATVLYGLGVTDAIPETIEASLQLSEAVLVDIGVPMGYVIASIHEKRDEFRKLLRPTSPADNPRHAIKMSTRVKDMSKPKKTEAPPPEAEPPGAMS
jgi:CPA2 family monovalent cation:H+ antiporter-2